MTSLGIIQHIEEVRDLHIEGDFHCAMDGYRVATDAHVFLVLIENLGWCCESWGYLQSEDDLASFVGQGLREVRLTDIARNQKILDVLDVYEGGAQLVDFVTSHGVFQIAVYNSHNGYYGHEIRVTQDQAVLVQKTV